MSTNALKCPQAGCHHPTAIHTPKAGCTARKGTQGPGTGHVCGCSRVFRLTEDPRLHDPDWTMELQVAPREGETLADVIRHNHELGSRGFR